MNKFVNCRECGLNNPSWRELAHYIKFLSCQIENLEKNDYFGENFIDFIPGFRQFAIKSLLQMAKVIFQLT